MFQTALGIVKEEGFFRLWRGITPAIYRHAIYTGVRFGAYEKMRDNVFKKNPDGSYSLWYIYTKFFICLIIYSHNKSNVQLHVNVFICIFTGRPLSAE